MTQSIHSFSLINTNTNTSTRWKAMALPLFPPYISRRRHGGIMRRLIGGTVENLIRIMLCSRYILSVFSISIEIGNKDTSRGLSLLRFFFFLLQVNKILYSTGAKYFLSRACFRGSVWTVELEIKRAHPRNPSDPNPWQQIPIILEDHTFPRSTTWSLLCGSCITKGLKTFSAVLAPSNPSVAQNSKGPSRPDRVANLKLQFRTFLSEATWGFTMKTILKIRAKYGLPLDGKKIAEVQKGFGLYGEGDSKNREHAAASSGNPHHQWLSVIERLYSHFLSTNTSLSLLSRIVPNLFTAPKDSSRRPTGKRRGKGGDKDADVVAVPEKDKVTSADEMLKAFCVKFVRLNGILFTRTSLETFSDVLGSTSSSLRDLIWSSLTEDMIFWLVTLLIFSVDNSKKDKGGQSYARNSLTASFELLGHVMEQCAHHHLRRDGQREAGDGGGRGWPHHRGLFVFSGSLCCRNIRAVGVERSSKRVSSGVWAQQENQCTSRLNTILVSPSSRLKVMRQRKVTKTKPVTETPMIITFLSVSIFLISRGSRLELYSHDRSLFPSLNDPVDAEFSLGSDRPKKPPAELEGILIRAGAKKKANPWPYLPNLARPVSILKEKRVRNLFTVSDPTSTASEVDAGKLNRPLFDLASPWYAISELWLKRVILKWIEQTQGRIKINEKKSIELAIFAQEETQLVLSQET
ncbi:hypothetical protein YC2023_120221 [Brassica napus]